MVLLSCCKASWTSPGNVRMYSSMVLNCFLGVVILSSRLVSAAPGFSTGTGRRILPGHSSRCLAHQHYTPVCLLRHTAGGPVQTTRQRKPGTEGGPWTRRDPRPTVPGSRRTNRADRLEAPSGRSGGGRGSSRRWCGPGRPQLGRRRGRGSFRVPQGCGLELNAPAPS